jgi:L-amino acid N-acyltransferase YncA
MTSDASSARARSTDLIALLRPCEPGDVPQITAIYAHAVRHGRASFELEPPDTAEMERRRDALVGAGYPYLVAEIGGVVVGYAYAGASRSVRPMRALPKKRRS